MDNEMHDELVRRAKALAPLLAEHAAEAERLRKPVDAVIRALEEAEIFKIMVPRCYGGFELDMDTLLEVVAALGEGDASMAWVASFCIEHNWIFCQYPEAFQRELFADRSYVLAPAMIAPTGKATKEGDGFRLSGRWQWATGVMHCDWVMASAVATGTDDPFDVRFFALPRGDVRVEDTWHVDGMEATGSNDVVVENVFVPEYRTVSLPPLLSGDGIGGTIHAGPLYRTPMLPLLAASAALPALGQARMAVRAFRERMAERSIMMLQTRQADLASAQIRLARVELETDEAELLMREAVRSLRTLRNQASLEQRAKIRAQIVLAVDRCRGVIDCVCEASGASAHFRSHPLQRARRDVNMMGCHAVFDLDAILQIYGALRVGIQPITPMI